MIKFFSVLGFILFFSLHTAAFAQNYSTHRVKEGETVESIAKRYYVTPFDIYSLNPEVKKGLKANTVLIIPVSKAVKPTVTTTKELQGFKTHRTSRKETLYSIAKEYHVTEDEIKKYNDFLYANVLQKGDKLQIPVFKETQVVASKERTKTYIVQPKEGKWRIAYKFGISVGELEALNPNMGETLQEGQQIYVPNIENEKEKEVDEKYSYYEVLPKEGFYRLKLKLGLEQEQLEALNPGLKESGLKVGMFLKIPFSKSVGMSVGTEVASSDLSRKISDYNSKHIAVMLPFRLNRVDFDSISGTMNSINNDRYLEASLDFHSGILMAVDSLKKLGISLKVDVYDTKYEVSEVSRIIQSHDFEHLDAVIGPLTPNCYEKAASELRGFNVPIVSPIGTNLQLKDNEFQSLASDDILKAKLINYVKTDTDIANIIIISDNNSENMAVSNELKREFFSAKQLFSRKSKEGKDNYYITLEDIRGQLKQGKNVVFLETKNAGFISNVTSLLNSLIQSGNALENKEGIKIVLTTTNKNPSFDGDEVNNNQLSALHFTFASNSRMYNESDDNAFVKAYTKLYNISPNKRAVRGFDLTMDVVLRLVTSKDLYLSANESALTEYVENKFAYKKKLFGGYYNDSAYLLKYEDLNIVEVKD
ncbi:PBP1 and LysM peptidoglycan-binding domain-containing protein [Confluentibacter sediminis]|uniref:PBP1 and LysM peptidoglycan-binding domain-containing protein n=1 Tax=Confluentibacter sediminis TaxID=2219045 RepID=UPI000DAED7BB|nr:LysM peptidoglycan-binding domain-containing protein [Confluentibacter sediminis]